MKKIYMSIQKEINKKIYEKKRLPDRANFAEMFDYKAIQLYEFIRENYSQKRLSPGTNFADMFDATIDVFEEGNNISFKKILNNIYMYQGQLRLAI